MQEDQPHFDHSTAAAAVAGATIGALVVLTAFLTAVLLTGADQELMAVGALAAAFGGTGFGAMLGAVLASVRGALVPAREPDAEARRGVVSS